MPDCHFEFVFEKPAEGQKQNAWALRCKEAKQIGVNVEMLADLDMPVAEPFVIPLQYTVDKQAHLQDGPFYAMAKRGGVSTRPRTAVARVLLQKVYDLVPAPEKPDVTEKMRTVALVDAGTEFTVGRLKKYYPRRGSIVKEPITRLEAARAWETELGRVLTDPMHFVYLEPAELQPKEFSSVDGSNAVRVNLQAGNGFPVMGKGDDPEAQALYLGLATTVRAELVDAYVGDPEHGVRRWLRRAEQERPWLVSLQGKCKADYYTGQKVWDKELRFYNVLGRQMALNIQTMFQVVEELSQSVLDGGETCSVSGASFTHGGADRMVREMNSRVKEDGSSHVRMGDDSWLVMLEDSDRGEILHMCALDCSAFDLTQHAELTYHVHQRLREIASQIDPVAATLQYEYFRERQVVTVRRDVRKWKHGGASGLPGQSKVNGAIMGVCIDRVLRMVDAKLIKGKVAITEERLNSIIQLVGSRMGLSIRVEQYCSARVGDPGWGGFYMHEALRQHSFLFMGYRFATRANRRVEVWADMPRSLSRMRYPSLLYIADKRDMEALEAARLASVITSWGLPPAEWQDAFEAAVKSSRELIEAVLRDPLMLERNDKRVLEVAAVSAVSEDVVPPPSSYEGLLRMLNGGFLRVWGSGPPEGAGLEEDMPRKLPGHVSRWSEVALAITPLTISREALDRAKIPVPSRKPTDKTAGRNPNTKVFGPPTAPRPRYFEARRVAPNRNSQLYSYDVSGRESYVEMEADLAYDALSVASRDDKSAWGSELDAESYEREGTRDREIWANAPFDYENRYLDGDEEEQYLDSLRWQDPGAPR